MEPRGMPYKLSVLLAVTCLLAACATVDVKSMTPDPPAKHATPSRPSLLVEPVADTPKGKRDPDAGSGKMFRETVVVAFRNANLFQSVVTEGGANLTLRINLMQQLHVPGGTAWEIRREVIADYVLLDEAGKSVW